ncbi:MAG: PDZ domain-containing protein, partial [Akkermansiaceae bacterium]|nr:PDZ domain-containing protein [Akkermansiaceae bacterium]
MLWRYPLPQNIGLEMDRSDGTLISRVTAASPAAEAGLTAGERIEMMDGQAVTSIADMQWVLHGAPDT